MYQRSGGDKKFDEAIQAAKAAQEKWVDAAVGRLRHSNSKEVLVEILRETDQAVLLGSDREGASLKGAFEALRRASNDRLDRAVSRLQELVSQENIKNVRAEIAQAERLGVDSSSVSLTRAKDSVQRASAELARQSSEREKMRQETAKTGRIMKRPNRELCRRSAKRPVAGEPAICYHLGRRTAVASALRVYGAFTPGWKRGVMSTLGSISQLIGRLKAHPDQEAAQQIYERYIERLVGLARTRLGTGSHRVADEEDVAHAAIKSLFEGISQGRFPG